MQQPPVPRLPQIGQQMQQQTVPGVKLSVNELRGTTRFNDLHEELQKVIENVDNFILNQIKLQEDCLTVSPKIENTSSQMAPDVEYCTKSLETIQSSLENDAQSIAFAKNLVKTDAVNAKLSFRAIQNLKQPLQFHQTDLWTTSTSSYSQGPSFSDQTAEEGASRNIVEYFSKQAEEMTRTLDTYKRNITEVETYLKDVESNTMQQMQQMMFSRAQDGGGKGAEDQVRELAAVLRDFEAGIMGVAAKVGSAREQVQEVMLDPTEAAGTRSRRYGMP
ncbi:hypothetical protein OEA41_001506 [Lepraria neglecta]|uniref:Uncharacterized protein n=1 Tax=Lepraria neglecta TaxID=209136 RepID=A0AAD9ZCI2_9LECA|nr:hypothetical protein OEA41_001506 [Lepraria neglecta]